MKQSKVAISLLTVLKGKWLSIPSVVSISYSPLELCSEMHITGSMNSIFQIA